MIFLRGIKAGQMQAVLDYVYSGATQVAEEDLANFIDVAEDLKINGLVNKYEDLQGCENDLITSQLINTDVLDGSQKKQEVNSEQTEEEPSLKDHVKDHIENPKEAEPVKNNVFIINHSTDDSDSIQNKTRGDKRKQIRTVEQLGNSKQKKQKSQPSLELTKNIQVSKPSLLNVSIGKPLTNKPATPPLHCPVCNMEVPNNFYMIAHMKSKRESQCQDCKLFFLSCQTLGIHKKGRCRSAASSK